MTSPYEIAQKLCELGFSVIPSGGGEKHKAPLVNWTEYQERQPEKRELENWQYKHKPAIWGIVTGNISGIVVLDADTPAALAALQVELNAEPHILTPRGGGHWYFKHPEHPVKTTVAIIPEVDIRADGGFINTVGSRPDGEYQIMRLPEAGNLLPWELMPEQIRKQLNGSKPLGAPTPARTRIFEGEGRNAACTTEAGRLANIYRDVAIVEQMIKAYDQTVCVPPLGKELKRTVFQSIPKWVSKAIAKRGNGNTDMYIYNASQQDEVVAKRNNNATHSATPEANTNSKTQQVPLSRRIEDWVTSTAGWFDTPELDRDLGINSVTDKNNRREIMLRLEARGIVERHQKISKQFRYVNTKVTSLAFKTASNAGVLPIRWPLGIERYVNLFPGNMAVVAGSPNAGKTALLLRFIYLNQDKFPIYYFCSEMGAVELRDRLDKFPGMDINDWHFEAIERASDFADVVKPDAINIIDYLEMTTDLYAVNTYLTAISHKIGTGLGLVAIQKKQDTVFGRGQEFGMEKPKLYLSMDKGKLQIVKGKSWATKNVDPHGLKVNFKIIGGCEFEVTNEWTWE